MIKRRQVRVLVPYNRTLYFLDKGGAQRGIIADMMTAFENDLNAQLKNRNIRVHVVLLPTSRERLIPDLLAGKGDLIAANLTVTPERAKSVDFSAPLASGVPEVVVASPGAPELKSLDDLSGQEVFLNRSAAITAASRN